MGEGSGKCHSENIYCNYFICLYKKILQNHAIFIFKKETYMTPKDMPSEYGFLDSCDVSGDGSWVAMGQIFF